MKKSKASERAEADSDDLLPEYRLDYTKARPNPYVGRVEPARRIVSLDPDVSEVFTTEESVNTVLRALIEAMPKRSRRTRARNGSRPIHD
jgi:hypothetical protein